MARLNVDVWAIQLMGRWGSTAVQRYVRDAAVSEQAAEARSIQMGRSLRALSAGTAAREDREQALAEARQAASETAHTQLEKVATNLRELLIEDLSALLAARLDKASPQDGSDTSSSATTSSQDEAAQPPATASTDSRAQSSEAAGLSGVVVSTASKRPVAHRILVGPA